MALKLIEPPLEEPVSLAEVKAFIKIETDREDDLLRRLIKTARQSVEAYTGRALIEQTWQFSLNAGYCAEMSDGGYLTGIRSRGEKGIELPRSPFIALKRNPVLNETYGIREIKDYRLDTSGRTARIHFGPTLEGLTSGKGVVEIEYTVGYGKKAEDVPEPLRQAVLMMVSELFENRVGSNDNQGMPPLLNQAVVDLIKPYRSPRLL